MSWTKPNESEGTYPDQSTLTRQNLDVLAAGLSGVDFVVFGGAVTGGASMTPSVAKGGVISAGVLWPVSSGTVTIGAPHATLNRIDLIVIDTAGAKQVRAGTPAALPLPPDRTANDVVLAEVYVGAAVTTIPTVLINDQRVVRGTGVTLKQTTTPVVHNNTSGAQTYFTVVLPSGLMLTGKQLEIILFGDYLINSGTPTVTFSVDYGGTTFFSDLTAAFTASANRGAWNARVLLNAQAQAVQQIDGMVVVQTPGAKTAPANGEGDLAVTTSVVAPFHGSSTVDSDAADQTLNVKLTMSVANASDEITAVGFARLL